KEIALAYGQSSGFSSYGDIGKGSRIIELNEGEFSFNTWISMVDGKSNLYNYPFGYSYDLDSNDRLPAINGNYKKNGIHYSYFEGEFKNVADIAGAHPKKSGIVHNISLNEADVDDFFAFIFEGFIEIPEPGLYQFYTYSDDGSQLYIGDQLVV